MTITRIHAWASEQHAQEPDDLYHEGVLDLIADWKEMRTELRNYDEEPARRTLANLRLRP